MEIKSEIFLLHPLVRADAQHINTEMISHVHLLASNQQTMILHKSCLIFCYIIGCSKVYNLAARILNTTKQLALELYMTRIYLLRLSALTSEVSQLSTIITRHIGLIFLASVLFSFPFDIIPFFWCRSHIPSYFANFLLLETKCHVQISLRDKNIESFNILKPLFIEFQMAYNIPECFHILVMYYINSHMFPQVRKGVNYSLDLMFIN